MLPMAEKTKAIILELRPKFQELRDARTYSEASVKRIMFAFARELGIDWPDDELREFIASAFDFD